MITIKVKKGKSETYYRIMNLAQCFAGVKEFKNHYRISIEDGELVSKRRKLEEILRLMSELEESEMFNIPGYGTSDWADFMIDLHRTRRLNP